MRASVSCPQLAEKRPRDDWSRIGETLSGAAEIAYCKAAGRLGLDPYDPETPDLDPFSKGLDPKLFEDISDAADLRELGDATA